MALTWKKEQTASWDADKKRIVGGAPEGIFDHRYSELEQGEIVPGEWWHVEENGQIVGYGWLDVVWGDAEILLVTAPSARNHGVGSFVLSRLEQEARTRGLNYLYNVVRPTHPNGEAVTSWLTKRGFEGAEDGSLRRAVPRR